MNYFATPVSSEMPFENYIKSVVNGVKKNDLEGFKTLPNEVLKQPDDPVHLWGIKFDKKSRWEKVNNGDILFFYRKGFIISWCVVFDKFHNMALAEYLWDGFQSNYVRWFTWPYILVLSKPNECNIPFETFNSLLGYVEGYSLRSFFKLNDNFKNGIEKNFDNIQDFIKNSSK
jgi:hypothetical protein